MTVVFNLLDSESVAEVVAAIGEMATANGIDWALAGTTWPTSAPVKKNATKPKAILILKKHRLECSAAKPTVRPKPPAA